MKRFALLLALVVPHGAWGHQPVMDMAPRWQGGYGLQVRVESEQKNKLEADGRGTQLAASYKIQSGLGVVFASLHPF